MTIDTGPDARSRPSGGLGRRSRGCGAAARRRRSPRAPRRRRQFPNAATLETRSWGSEPWSRFPAGSRVAVDSPLRRAQVLARRGDLDLVLATSADSEESENRVTSLASLEDPEDAVELFQIDDWPTAPGQGGLVLLTRKKEERLVASVDHRPSRLAILAELGVLARVGAESAPHLAAHALFDDGLLFLSARLYRAGRERSRDEFARALSRGLRRIRSSDLAKRVADELLAYARDRPEAARGMARCWFLAAASGATGSPRSCAATVVCRWSLR